MSLCRFDKNSASWFENVEFLYFGGLEHIVAAAFELLVLDLLDYFLAFEYFVLKDLVLVTDFFLELRYFF